jgi:hypothetical protein
MQDALKRRSRAPDAKEVIRRVLLLLAFVAAVLIIVSMERSNRPEIPPPRAAAAPTDGVRCFRQGGFANYCRCLDRLELARGGPGGQGLPSFKDPAVRYALAHPREYPVINNDTPQCLRPRKPAPGGTPA